MGTNLLDGNDKATLFKLLRTEVEETFGKKVMTYGDCLLLSDDVLYKTSYRVNPNTLRRFFGLVKTRFQPSWSTQTILAQYCGFESLQRLLKENSNEHDRLSEEHVVDFLISIFKSVPVRDYTDETFLAIVKRTIQFLQKHPHMADSFQKVIAKTKNGQDFYFEQFVNIDGLNALFSKGLLYYLNEKKTPGAQLFGHSLLALKGWFTDDLAYCKKHYEIVTSYRLNTSKNPFVCAQYFATRIYYAEMIGQNVDEIIQEAQLFHRSLKQSSRDYCFFPGFEYTLASSLVLTGYHSEALYYSDFGLKNYPSRHSYVEEGFYQSLKLIKAHTLAKTGQIKESEKVFSELRPSRFYFLTRKVNTIIYLHIKKILRGLTVEEERQIGQIIKETGLSRIIQHL